MKTSITILTIMLMVVAGWAQDSKFVNDMEAALTIHDTASTVASEIIALDTFRNLCKQYNKEWLPHYWTAYLLTQVARLKGRAPGFPENLEPQDLIDESQARFDTANRILSNKTDIQKSDFHALQGFIYNWYEIFNKDETKKKQFREKSEAEYQLAIKLNPQSPLMYVIVGIDLLRLGRERDYKDAFTSVAMLNYADEVFSREPKRSMTTYWNKDFIPYWRSVAEKKMQELLKESGS